MQHGTDLFETFITMAVVLLCNNCKIRKIVVLVFILPLLVTSCPSFCTDKLLITVADGNIDLVNKVVGKYEIIYQKQITKRIHGYKMNNVSVADPCLAKEILHDMRFQAPETILNIYQSEEISLPVKITGTQKKHNKHRYKTRRKKRGLHVHDPLGSSPHYGMGIMGAWQLGYRGQGVVVGIVDTGIEVDHSDLNPNLDLELSCNFVEDQPDGNVNPDRLASYMELDSDTDHGNICAGLVGAVQGNNFCSSGVAPEAKLAALKFLGLNDPSRYMDAVFKFRMEALIKALRHKADQIHIFSNSYGPELDFAKSSTTLNNAFMEGVTEGRNGKGSIYVMAAGNSGLFKKNANLDGFVNSIYTITISSVGVNGTIPDFAQPGACILASTVGEGPSLLDDSLVSTSHGNSCTDGIKGTSASTAIASGIIALVLQANPELTWRDVQHLIVNTSQLNKLDGNEILTTNTAGYTFHPYFGFGLMNASALVITAKGWTSVPTQRHVYNSTVLRGNTEEIYCTTLELCQDISRCVSFTEHVTAYIIYVSFYDPLVELKLCSPSGTCSHILTKQNTNSTLTAKRVRRKWTFMSVQFWGEDPEGTWTLSMDVNTDKASVNREGKSFSLKRFKLTVYGYSNASDWAATNAKLTASSRSTPQNTDSEEVHVAASSTPPNKFLLIFGLLVFFATVFIFHGVCRYVVLCRI